MRISPHMIREIRRTDLAGRRTRLDERTSLFLIYAILQSIARALLSLTSAFYRHNNHYIRFAGKSYGQTQKARSKTAGTQTHRYSPPSPRRGLRHFVPPESLLRPQRPAASALRDAAAPPCGRRFYRRCFCDVRRLSPHLLSGSGCIPASWPERPATETPRAQTRAQAVRRGHRVCADLASCRGRLDHRRLCPSRSGKVRDHGAPPQSGAGVGEQKKTAPFGVRSPIPAGTVEAYEGLRRKVVQQDGRGQHLEGRGVLTRCGLATWAQIRPAAVPTRPPESHFPSGAEAPVLDSLGAELVRLVAGLILSNSTGGFSVCLN